MGRIQRKELNNKKRNIYINKNKPAGKTRKQLRKEKRQQKKLNRASYYQKKKSKNQLEETVGKSYNSEKNDKDKLSGKKERNDGVCVQQVPSMKAQKRQKPKSVKEGRVEKNAKKQKLELLNQANFEEDKMIKQLEKRLKLNKRKSKSIPKSFMADGLDCILYNFYNFTFAAFAYFIQK